MKWSASTIVILIIIALIHEYIKKTLFCSFDTNITQKSIDKYSVAGGTILAYLYEINLISQM